MISDKAGKDNLLLGIDWRPSLLGEDNYTHLITRRLKDSMIKHQILLRFGVLIAEFYNVPLTLILIGSFSTMTVSFVQVTDPELINTKTVLYTIVQVFQLFILSYLGQSGTDASEEISAYAYNADWYECPPNFRKLLQMVILRSSKPCKVVAFSMYNLTLANFMSVMQTITSCYMLLR